MVRLRRRMARTLKNKIKKKKSVINYLLMAILKVLVIRKLSSKKNVIFLEKTLKKKIISFSIDFDHFHFLQKL